MAFELKEEGFRLKDVLLVVGTPEATYHYHVKNFDRENPDAELKRRVEEYIYWYNHERSKEKLAGLSPVEYRTQSSQSAA
ncbi:transposase InsO family protein [Virgibacillus campisalis]|uniref:Transposase InsO family protein n=1 Tax=Virgibacillus alimentarius TaxID=698769 RepID=A0ABS4SA38_9BACI|nr:transposase InsO family protein [Virgibacillus alimentarius]